SNVSLITKKQSLVSCYHYSFAFAISIAYFTMVSAQHFINYILIFNKMFFCYFCILNHFFRFFFHKNHSYSIFLLIILKLIKFKVFIVVDNDFIDKYIIMF